MKISYNWLCEYVGFRPNISELSDQLTAVGLEVEGVETYRSVPFPLSGVVTGAVVECSKHPEADRLSLTKVDTGNGVILDIVCGAPNVAAGQKVLVATVGTKLPDGKGGSFEIKEARIRGAISQGMICAEDELGLSDNHDGIMVLPESTPLGLGAEEYLGVYEDTIFEIGLTPNRSDANSHIGVARDVVAFHKVHNAYDGKLIYPTITKRSSSQAPSPISISIVDSNKCLRYCGITLNNVTVKESPDWLKNRLHAIGQASINNVVDITNYVLWEMGQPLHAFDAEKIQGKAIKVQTLPAKTPFIALDGRTYLLDAEDLVICDGHDAPLCMAGVYGGQDSGVTASTTRVFLESALFAASNIRRTSQRHVLHTSAAKAFEKGVDPENTLQALWRAVDLLIEYADATVEGDWEDCYPRPIERAVIEIGHDFIAQRSGTALEINEAGAILTALEMDVEVIEDGIKVTVPSNKPDVQRPADLLEEVLRIYGLDNIPMSGAIRFTLQPAAHPDKEETKAKLADWLAARGYQEIMCLSLSQSKYFKEQFQVPSEELVFIHNTSNTHLDVMRHNMLAGGLEVLAYNINRRQTDLTLFEMGSSYSWKGSEAEEREQIILWQTGRVQGENWLQKGVRAGFYSLKSAVEQLLQRFAIYTYQTEETREGGFAYGLRYYRGDKTLVTFGALSANLCKAMDIKQEVFAAVFEWEACWAAIRTSRIEVKEPSKFPEVRRDLSMIVPSTLSFGEVKKAAFHLEKKWLKEVNLFDVYEHPEHVGPDKKSYAISFSLQSEEQTLSDKELDAFLQRMIDGLESRLGAQIRR
jgi:phenylalanyl-tRNA synthetase beta chain